MLDRYVDAAGVIPVPVEVALTNLEQGRRPPVLASQNLDGRPSAERNAELLAPYLARAGGGR